MSPFKQFYSGQTATALNEQGTPWLLVPQTPAVVVWCPDLANEIQRRLQDGAVLLGQANWNGPNVGSEAQAIAQAKAVGATVVLWYYEYASSTSGVMPITTPTTTTTYGSGSVYGSYGVTNWSGTATTYGTRTTYMPFIVHRYNVSSAFLGTRAVPPKFGAMVRELTPADQAAAGTTKGLLVTLVVRNSPAANAEILPGDVLSSINQQAMERSLDLSAAIERSSGTTVEIEIRRNGANLKKLVPLN